MFWLKILTAYLFIVLGLYFLQYSILYLPDKTKPIIPIALSTTITEVKIKTQDNLELLSWYMPAKNNQATILYLHGNAGNIANRLFSIERFVRKDCGVFLLEYRAYGGNPGKPREKGFLLDIAAAYTYLLQQGIPSSKIIIFGESIGSSLALQFAAKHEIGGLILQSPFLKLAPIAQRHYFYLPAYWLLRDKYDNTPHVNKINVPVIVLASPQDEIIPFKQSVALYELLPPPKAFIKVSGGHNDSQIYDTPIDMNFFENKIP